MARGILPRTAGSCCGIKGGREGEGRDAGGGFGACSELPEQKTCSECGLAGTWAVLGLFFFPLLMMVVDFSLFFCRCKTCGEYIYKGKKFNARKETVQNEVYLGLPIFRFYIKCTRCLAEITFKVKCAGGSSERWEHGVCPYPVGKGLPNPTEAKAERVLLLSPLCVSLGHNEGLGLVACPQGG